MLLSGDQDVLNSIGTPVSARMTTATKLTFEAIRPGCQFLIAMSFEGLRRGAHGEHKIDLADDASRLEQDLVRLPNWPRARDRRRSPNSLFGGAVDRQPFPVLWTEGSAPPIGEAKPGERERDDAERRHAKECRPGIGSI